MATLELVDAPVDSLGEFVDGVVVAVECSVVAHVERSWFGALLSAGFRTGAPLFFGGGVGHLCLCSFRLGGSVRLVWVGECWPSPMWP